MNRANSTNNNLKCNMFAIYLASYINMEWLAIYINMLR